MLEPQNNLMSQPPVFEYTVAGPPLCGEETANFVVTYLTFLKDTEQLLSDSLAATARRHSGTVDAHDLCLYLARYSQSNAARLDPFIHQYQRALSRNPPAEGVRSVLLDGGHLKELMLLMDLQDIALLVNQAKLGWTILQQIALTLKDQDLKQTASLGLSQARQQLHWLERYIKLVVLQTAVPSSQPLVA